MIITFHKSVSSSYLEHWSETISWMNIYFSSSLDPTEHTRFEIFQQGAEVDKSPIKIMMLGNLQLENSGREPRVLSHQ